MDQLTRPTTFVTKSGRKVVVSPVDENGERFSLEYLGEDSEVQRYRPSVPASTIQDLERLEVWTRQS